MPQVKIVADDADFSTRRITVCMFCGAELPAETRAECPKPRQKGADALSALLGGADEEARAKIELSEEENRFCRTCSHFVPHPFVCRCGLTNRPADPMGDCPRWQLSEAAK